MTKWQSNLLKKNIKSWEIYLKSPTFLLFLLRINKMEDQNDYKE